MQLEYVLYTSKNYLFPDSQLYPHTSWEESVCPNYPIFFSPFLIFQEAYLHRFFPEENSFVLGNHEDDHIFLFTYSPVYSCRQGILSEEQSYSGTDQLPTTAKFDCTSDVDSVEMVVFDSSPNPSECASVSECTGTSTTTCYTNDNDNDNDNGNGNGNQQQHPSSSSLKESESPLSALSPEIVQSEQCKAPTSSYHQESPTAMDQCGTPYEGGLDMCLLNMMMYDMNEEVAQLFFNKPGVSAKDVTVCSTIEIFVEIIM